MEKSRIAGIEIFRIVSIIAVISLHTYPFGLLAEKNIYFFKCIFYIINNLCRFAVPFFFIVAGYFFGKKIRSQAARLESIGVLLKYLKRLLIIFFSWSLIYIFLPSLRSLETIIKNKLSCDFFALLSKKPLDALYSFRRSPLDFIMQGGSVPLWFLTALMLALIIITGVYILKKEKYLFIIAVSFYVFGLLARAGYGDTPIGIHLPFIFNTRNGPFMSLLFVSLGWWVSGKKKFYPKVWQAITVIIAGFLLQELEAYSLWKFYHASLIFNYLIGTVPFAFGVFLLALSIPGNGKVTILSKISSLTLGIYVTHSLFLSFFKIYISPLFPIVLWQFLYPLLVFLVSAIFVYFLRKIPILKALVT